MSREIKFRAWDKKRKRMYDVLHLHSETYNYGLFTWATVRGKDVIQQKDIHLQIQPKDCILMQFTGLRDKNGKEIYEGDILSVCNGSVNGIEWMDKPYEVKYRLNKGFIMCMFCWDNDGNSIMNSTHWCEVIGNIYETPELVNA